jgi:hypothetical protein
MNTRPLLIACALVVSPVGILGCGGTDASLEAKSAHDQGKGTTRVYDATNDQTWSAAHVAISWNEVGTPTDHPEGHYLLTDPKHFDQIGIWLQPEGADKTRVNVVVIDDPNLPGPNEEGVQKDIATALGQVKAGQTTAKRP